MHLTGSSTIIYLTTSSISNNKTRSTNKLLTILLKYFNKLLQKVTKRGKTNENEGKLEYPSVTWEAVRVLLNYSACDIQSLF